MQAHRNLAIGLVLALSTVWVAAALGAPASTSAPALEVIPAEVHFNSIQGSATLNLTLGGAAVKAKDIKSAVIADKAWMFKVTKSAKDPGTVTVATLPDKVEDGSYRLAVTVAGQTAYADVFVTLTPTASASPLSFLPPRLEFDDSYAQGTTLTYKLEAPLDLDYAWTVNGKTVLQGPGETKLVYTFAESGPCTIAVTAKQGEKVVGQSQGATRVIPPQPIPQKL